MRVLECLGAALGVLAPSQRFRGAWVLPWGQEEGGDTRPGEPLGVLAGVPGGVKGSKGPGGVRGGLLTFKSLWTMNFWWQYCTADTICRRGGCQEGGPPPQGEHRGISPNPLGTQRCPQTAPLRCVTPDLSKLRSGLLLLHAPVGHQVVENLAWKVGGGENIEGRGEQQPCPLPACCPPSSACCPPSPLPAAHPRWRIP